MRNKSDLLFLPVLCTALWSMARLAGFPGGLHLTGARLLFMLLITAGCAAWMLFFRSREKIAANEAVSSIMFHTSLLLTTISLFLTLSSPYLMRKDGILYSIGAFIQQAQPYLIFVIVCCACTVCLIISTQSSAGTFSFRKLVFANTFIPEAVLLFLACMLVFGAFIPLRDNYYPSHDSAIFTYFGQQILRGKMPYTELWDHKPPLIFYFDALGLKIANGSMAGIWLLEFVLFYLGSLILLRLLKHHFPKWISVTVLSLGMLHYVRVLDFGNYTEELSLFFVICAIGLYFSHRREHKLLLFGLLNGLLCGLAFTSKQNTIGCWAALFLLTLTEFIVGKTPERIKRAAAYWSMTALGFLLINAGWVLYFAAHNALEAYWDVAFRFNFIYSDRSTDSRLACALTTLTFLPSVSPYLLLGFLSWIGACGSLIKSAKDFLLKNELTTWAVIALPIELVLAGLSGMNYQHYFILCITPVIILLCHTLDLLTGKILPQKQFIKPCLIMVLCISSLPLIRFFRDNYMPRTPSSYTKARDYLLSDTHPDQPILVWGSRTAIYVMSERYAPTAYFNERPLYLFPDAVQAKQWAELLSNLQRDPPQVIIYTHDTALPFIEDNGNGCTLPPYTADYAIPVYQYFCDHYRYETAINPEFNDAWDIYSRK